MTKTPTTTTTRTVMTWQRYDSRNDAQKSDQETRMIVLIIEMMTAKSLATTSSRTTLGHTARRCRSRALLHAPPNRTRCGRMAGAQRHTKSVEATSARNSKSSPRLSPCVAQERREERKDARARVRYSCSCPQRRGADRARNLQPGGGRRSEVEWAAEAVQGGSAYCAYHLKSFRGSALAVAPVQSIPTCCERHMTGARAADERHT